MAEERAGERARDATGALPGALGDIEKVAGRGAAVSLAIEFGGQELHIPGRAHLEQTGSDHPLVRLVGWAAASHLVQHSGGTRLYIPHARREIARMLARQGLSAIEISRRLRVSKRAVLNYLREKQT